MVSYSWFKDKSLLKKDVLEVGICIYIYTCIAEVDPWSKKSSRLRETTLPLPRCIQYILCTTPKYHRIPETCYCFIHPFIVSTI